MAVVIVELDRQIAGVLEVRDELRHESVETTRLWRKQDIDVVMLTGEEDRTAHQRRARHRRDRPGRHRSAGRGVGLIRGRNCQQRTLMLKDMRLTAVDGTPSGSRRGAVAWIVLVLGAVALLLLGLWTTSAHDSIERSAATATVSIGGDRAPSDSAVSDAEVVVVLAPEGAGAEETALCLLGALCCVLLAIAAARSLMHRPRLLARVPIGVLLFSVPRPVPTFTPVLTPALLGISRT